MTEEYIPQAVKLALAEYEQEQKKSGQLIKEDFEPGLTGMLYEMVKCTYSVQVAGSSTFHRSGCNHSNPRQFNVIDE